MRSKSAIARENGRKSRGPRTEAGKQRSSLNAVKHGRYAVESALLPIESSEAFARLVEEHRLQFRPATPNEDRIVQQIASIDWRLHRLILIETAILEKELKRQYYVLAQLDREPDQVEMLAEAAKAADRDSAYPRHLAAQQSRLIRDRNALLRTLAQMRKLAPAVEISTELVSKEQFPLRRPTPLTREANQPGQPASAPLAARKSTGAPPISVETAIPM